MNSPAIQGLPLNPPSFVKHARLIAWVEEMAALTELGFLRQPHTSAGRVPTETG